MEASFPMTQCTAVIRYELPVGDADWGGGGSKGRGQFGGHRAKPALVEGTADSFEISVRLSEFMLSSGAWFCGKSPCCASGEQAVR